MASANRSKSRDRLDLYVLLQRGVAEPIKILRAFESADVAAKFDFATKLLCQAMPNAEDEG